MSKMKRHFSQSFLKGGEQNPMLCEGGQPLLFGGMCMKEPVIECIYIYKYMCVSVCVCLCDEWDMLDLGQANLRNLWHPHFPCTCLYSKCGSVVCVCMACMCQGIRGLKSSAKRRD